MKQFVKQNKMIAVSFVISIIIIVLYLISLDYKEWFHHGGDYFNFLFQLSIGIVINTIFYFTQVYLAQKKQREYANKCVIKRIKKIENAMQELLDHLAHVYLKGEVDSVVNIPFSEEQLLKMLNNLNLDDRVDVAEPAKVGMPNPELTVKEWLLQRMGYIEGEINRLFVHYAQFITPETMEVLDKILNSMMHINMGRKLLLLTVPIDFRSFSQDLYFKQYYDLRLELGNMEKDYL